MGCLRMLEAVSADGRMVPGLVELESFYGV